MKTYTIITFLYILSIYSFLYVIHTTKKQIKPITKKSKKNKSKNPLQLMVKDGILSPLHWKRGNNYYSHNLITEKIVGKIPKYLGN